MQQAHQSIADLQYKNEQLKVKSEALEESNEYLVNEHAKLVEAIDATSLSLAASDVTNNNVHKKLQVAEENIQTISFAKKTCEDNLKDAKKNHRMEIDNANSVIKSLEKDKKSLGKELYNLNRTLEGLRDKLKNLKSDQSSLKLCKNKLEAEINKLKKVISQKDSTIGKLRKNEELDLNENHKIDIPETFSSTMSGSSSLRSKSESQYISSTS